jgi:hypothetical protein
LIFDMACETNIIISLEVFITLCLATATPFSPAQLGD